MVCNAITIGNRTVTLFKSYRSGESNSRKLIPNTFKDTMHPPPQFPINHYLQQLHCTSEFSIRLANQNTHTVCILILLLSAVFRSSASLLALTSVMIAAGSIPQTVEHHQQAVSLLCHIPGHQQVLRLRYKE